MDDKRNLDVLINYIRAAYKAGVSDEQIAEALTTAGWKLPDILPVLRANISHFVVAENLAASSIAHSAVQAVDVKKSFGKVEALKGVSLEVPFGKIVGLLGPNGAGKTTLVRILTTLLEADAGSATVAGLDVLEQADAVRATVGLTGQNTAIDDYLTGRENMELVGKLYHLKKDFIKKRAQELLDKFGLTDAADRRAKNYSGGMRRRLDLAMSLFNSPKVLFLDEPTTGLDPQSRLALWGIIKELVAEGTTVLLTTQYLEEADNLADTIIVINHGEVIAQGTPDELKSRIGGDVLEIHLKQSADGARAAGILAHLTKEGSIVQQQAGIVSVPTLQGTAGLLEAVRQLDNAGIGIADIMLRRPTMDDVFLTLTGHSANLNS